MRKLLFDSAAAAINYDSLKLRSIAKVFFTIWTTADSCNVLNFELPPHQFESII